MSMARRLGQRAFGHPVEWGPEGQRGYMSDERWAEPLRWNRQAERTGGRPRVFCGSMMDVFEGKADQRPHLERLYALIDATPHLDWMLLTKRPNNALKLAPRAWPENVWIGCTIETKEWAERRLPHLLALDCTIRFVSVEPMLSALDLRPYLGPGRGQINWVIFGGESGMQARGPEGAVSWYRDLRAQCLAADVPLFFKQWGAFKPSGDQLIKLKPSEKRAVEPELDGIVWQQVPRRVRAEGA
jgi:protein gp37